MKSIIILVTLVSLIGCKSNVEQATEAELISEHIIEQGKKNRENQKSVFE